MSSMTRLGVLVPGLWVALSLVGCRSEAVREFLDNYTPHERYERRLVAAGLDQTALGREWVAAATTALQAPVTVEVPYGEESYHDARRAMATAYRVALRRGQQLEVWFDGVSDGADRVFIDLFRAPRDSGDIPRYVTSADSLERALSYLVRRDGDYLVRVQPELLVGGRYRITIEVEPSLGFPVSGHDTTAIQSRYGAPRDGGRRDHQGLDIFAPRGTPVVAAADGYIRSTRPNNLGGKVIWLRDRHERTLYYAHLDSVAVVRGQAVLVGDTIGFVGNSGNARTTPPHLHFGVYARGAFDPYPALFEFPYGAEAFIGDPSAVGQLVRTSGDRVLVRALPVGTGAVVARLDRHTPVRIEAGTGSWYRVELPDGIRGFVSASEAESLAEPIRRHRVLAASVLTSDPEVGAAPVDRLPPDSEVSVLGMYRGFGFAQSANGTVGWLALD